MPIILQVIICSLIGGLFSLIGGIIILANRKHAKLAEYLTAFAAGALLAAAFLDILPEALESGDVHAVLLFTLLGIVVFFLLESFLGWFHHHGKSDDHQIDPVVPMIIIGDTIHNFLDGLAIAAGFLVSPVSGIIITLAVAAHEIPQEVGDFGLLLHKGLSRRKVLSVNILSSLATVVSATLFYLIGDNFDFSFAPALGLIAGFFLYVAVSDIIPSIHHSKNRKLRLQKVALLLAGILVVGLTVTSLHGLAHGHSDSEHSAEHSETHDHD